MIPADLDAWFDDFTKSQGLKKSDVVSALLAGVKAERIALEVRPEVLEASKAEQPTSPAG